MHLLLEAWYLSVPTVLFLISLTNERSFNNLSKLNEQQNKLTKSITKYINQPTSPLLCPRQKVKAVYWRRCAALNFRILIVTFLSGIVLISITQCVYACNSFHARWLIGPLSVHQHRLFTLYFVCGFFYVPSQLNVTNSYFKPWFVVWSRVPPGALSTKPTERYS